jgi:glycerophosphoryl diester phosphodiesterase
MRFTHILIISLILCFTARGETIGISHRGLAKVAPENTIPAFTAAHGLADMIESDVRVSADGHLVIIHDTTVDRTTDGTGLVSNLTLHALRALDAGSWFSNSFTGVQIPTFAEMITNILPHATPLIEHKTGSASAYVTALQELGVTTKVMLQSFDWSFLRTVSGLDSSIPLCALGNGLITTDKLAGVIRSGAGTVAWEKAAVNPDSVNLVHSMGLKLFVWTLARGEVAAFIDMGVDGVITDSPDFAIRQQHPEPSVEITGIQPVAPGLLEINVEAKGIVRDITVQQAGPIADHYMPDDQIQPTPEGRVRYRMHVPATTTTSHAIRVSAQSPPSRP